MNACAGLQLCGDDGCLGACVCDDGSGSNTSGAPGDGGSSNGGGLDGAVGDGGSMHPPPAMQGHDAGKQPPPAQDHDASVTQQPPPKTVEDCSNGIDDDGDGDPDCADSDCSDWSCDGAAPTGWTGPSVVYVGSDPPNCGGDYSKETLAGGTAVDAAAASCSTCSCSNATAACATFVNVFGSTDMQCGGANCGGSVSGTCDTVNLPCAGATAYVHMELPTGLASCQPTAAQDPTIGDATWKKEVRACTDANKLHIGGCAEGEVCSPKTPFAGSICVTKSGDLACPNSVYSEKHVYYKGMNDTRGCSDCGCDHDCSYAWRVDASCNASFGLGENSCSMASPSSGQVKAGVQITGTGTCAATGGQPIGSAEATGPVTVCCQP
jgi:hypothetical protein